MDQQPVQIMDEPEFSTIMLFNEVCRYGGKIIFTSIWIAQFSGATKSEN